MCVCVRKVGGEVGGEEGRKRGRPTTRTGRQAGSKGSAGKPPPEAQGLQPGGKLVDGGCKLGVGELLWRGVVGVLQCQCIAVLRSQAVPPARGKQGPGER